MSSLMVDYIMSLDSCGAAEGRPCGPVPRRHLPGDHRSHRTGPDLRFAVIQARTSGALPAQARIARIDRSRPRSMTDG